VEIYKLLINQIRISQEQIATTRIIHHIPSSISLYWKEKHRDKENPTLIPDRIGTVAEVHRKMGDVARQSVFQLEYYEIVIPEFHIFRRMLVRQITILDNIFNEYFTQLIHFLPFDAPTPTNPKNIFIPAEPTAKEFEQLDTIADRYSEQCLELTCYFQDLMTEAQNQLLGNLFNRRVPLGCRETRIA
jgi:hypothetical protein